MKRKTVMILEAVCLIAGVSTAAVLVGNHEEVMPVLASISEDLSTKMFPDRKGAEKELLEMIKNLPAAENVDTADETAAESVYYQIADIYELSEKNGIILSEAQEKKIKTVIDTYYPAEEIANMQPIPESGGVLSSGSYALKSDLSLTNLNIVIPSGAEVTIDLNGYTLTGTGSGSVIKVESGGTLILKDSSFYPSFRSGSLRGGTGTILEEYHPNYSAGGGIFVEGYFHMLSGNITDCTADSGGGVYISDKGSFLMSGGNIEECTASGNMNVYGGGVQVSGSGSFQMDGGSIRNCSVIPPDETDRQSFGGGGVSVYNGTFTMNGGLISQCFSGYHGGGVYIADKSKSVIFAGGTIEECSADINGGGIYILNNSNVSMTGGTVKKCYASGGGAVCIQGEYGKFDLSGGELSGSRDEISAEKIYNAEDGGAAYILGGTFNMSGGTIRDFASSNNGGAVYIGSNSKAQIMGGSIMDCEADANGGGIYMNGNQAVIYGGNISECEAGNNGGGIYVLNGTVTLGDNAVIEKCTSAGDAVTSDDTGEMTLWDGGGGIFISPYSSVYFEGGKISGCVSASFGGGVFCYGELFFYGGEITECIALGGGGILLADDSSLFMSGGSIKNCAALNGNGGGINFSGGTMNLEGTPVICENINKKEETAVNDDLYIPEGRLISFSSELSEGAYVGISVPESSLGGNNIVFTQTGYFNDEAQYFFSDIENMIIEYDYAKNCLKLVYVH